MKSCQNRVWQLSDWESWVAGWRGACSPRAFLLTVYNRNQDKAAPFASAGATVAGSPREAASGAEIIISMVADDVASRGVWLGENGALAGAHSRSGAH